MKLLLIYLIFIEKYFSLATFLPEKEMFLHDFLREGYFVFNIEDKVYEDSLLKLGKQAKFCKDKGLRINLEDGSNRFTIARDNQKHFPKCVENICEKIKYYFNKVDNYVSEIMDGEFSADINITSEDHQTLGLKDLPTRTHLHVYTAAPHDEDDLNHDNDDLDDDEFSVPFHTDSGLFLLLTPSHDSPLNIMTRDGRMVQVPGSDEPGSSVICLVGTGLSDWLLPGHDLFAPAHAVPSLRHSSSRTVLARMKIAPLEARNKNSDISFAEHFYSILHQSAKTTFEKRHMKRMRRQADHDISQHWPGQVSSSQNKTVSE